jgi:hypothetical protein
MGEATVKTSRGILDGSGGGERLWARMVSVWLRGAKVMERDALAELAAVTWSSSRKWSNPWRVQ